MVKGECGLAGHGAEVRRVVGTVETRQDKRGGRGKPSRPDEDVVGRARFGSMSKLGEAVRRAVVPRSDQPLVRLRADR